MLMLRGGDVSEWRMGFGSCQSISAHQIGNHNIFLELRERPDYRSSHLQMICWQQGHSGTSEWPAEEFASRSEGFCIFCARQ